jgi:hypothetical protein
MGKIFSRCFQSQQLPQTPQTPQSPQPPQPGVKTETNHVQMVEGNVVDSVYDPITRSWTKISNHKVNDSVGGVFGAVGNSAVDASCNDAFSTVSAGWDGIGAGCDAVSTCRAGCDAVVGIVDASCTDAFSTVSAGWDGIGAGCDAVSTCCAGCDAVVALMLLELTVLVGVALVLMRVQVVMMSPVLLAMPVVVSLHILMALI